MLSACEEKAVLCACSQESRKCEEKIWNKLSEENELKAQAAKSINGENIQYVTVMASESRKETKRGSREVKGTEEEKK